MSKKKFDVELLLAIVIMVVGPSLQRKEVSLSGHAIGAVSGIVAGLIWKFVNKGN